MSTCAPSTAADGIGTILHLRASEHARRLGKALHRRVRHVALKQAQITAVQTAGLAYLRGQNDLANAPMRRVNEKLGYEKRFEWVQLGGPLLA
jgi:hypothetical protein